MDDWSDQQLVEHFAGGEAAAFDVLHRRYAARVSARLRAGGLDLADAADVAQDVFVRAFRSARQFDPARGSFATWLGAIARNCLARHLRRRYAAPPTDVAAATEALAGDEPLPESTASTREEIAAVDDCIGRLPAELRRIIECRYAVGLSTRAIAQQVGMSEAGIRNRLTEAKDRLRQCLNAKGVLAEGQETSL